MRILLKNMHTLPDLQKRLQLLRLNEAAQTVTYDHFCTRDQVQIKQNIKIFTQDPLRLILKCFYTENKIRGYL